MASIKKVPTGWRVRWRTPDGRGRSKTFPRKADAQRYLTHVEHTKLSGVYVDPRAGRVTVREYGDAWLASRVSWKPSTRVRYEGILERHIYPVLGPRPLASVRPTDVQSLVTALSSSFAPFTVSAIYRVLRSVYRLAVRDRLVATNPCVEIDLPKVVPRLVVPLTLEQVEAIAQAIGLRYRPLVILGAGAGLRVGEALGMPLSGVDFARRELRVTQQVVTVRRVTSLGPPKSAASFRTIPLADTVAEELAEHLQRYPVAPGGLLVTGNDGAAIPEGRFTHTWQAAVKRAGLAPGIRFHDLRHTFASALIAAGCSVKVVQIALGHGSVATTLDTYAHLWPTDADRTRAAIDGYLRAEVTDAGDQRSAATETGW
ncbi:MAG: site-specific integrase [Acidimicrobiaceae bacterium]|nr:site-specific integrase [Acidimicrobiaceae bacterium]